MRSLTLAFLLTLMLALTACSGDSGGDSSSGSSSGGGSGGGGGGGGSAQTGNSATSAEQSLAQQVLALVNQERANASLSPLSWSAECAQVAYDHSWDMDYRDFFSHTNPDGADPFDRMAAASIGYSAAGENIAAGQSTPAAVMTAWMNSAGHRANILNPNYTEMGVGVRDGSTGQYGIYWTQLFRRP